MSETKKELKTVELVKSSYQPTKAEREEGGARPQEWTLVSSQPLPLVCTC